MFDLRLSPSKFRVFKVGKWGLLMDARDINYLSIIGCLMLILISGHFRVVWWDYKLAVLFLVLSSLGWIWYFRRVLRWIFMSFLVPPSCNSIDIVLINSINQRALKFINSLYISFCFIWLNYLIKKSYCMISLVIFIIWFKKDKP